MQEDTQKAISEMCTEAKKVGSMYLDIARLTAAEKATAIFSMLAIALIVLMLGMVVLVFITMGIASLLEEYIAPFWSFFIVAGVFILSAVLLFLLREKLIFDPVARFMSKLFLNPPK